MDLLKSRAGRPHQQSEAGRFLSAVAEHCGDAAVDRLCAELGGQVIGIPRSPEPHHRLCQVLGVEGVRLIAASFGHGRIELPLGVRTQAAQRLARVCALTRDGLSVPAIAKQLGCSIRTVSRCRRRQRVQAASS